MAAVESLREVIARVLRSWEEYPNPALSLFRIVGVLDTARDRYTLTHVDSDGDRYKSHLLAYLEIRDGKIWILIDNTEDWHRPRTSRRRDRQRSNRPRLLLPRPARSRRVRGKINSAISSVSLYFLGCLL